MVQQTAFDSPPLRIGRHLGIAAFALVQAAVVSYLFDLPEPVRVAAGAFADLGRLALQGAIVAAVVLGLILWPRREQIRRAWVTDSRDHRFGFWLAINAASFLVVAVASLLISALARVDGDLYFSWIWAYAGLLLVHACTLAATIASPGFWWQTLRGNAVALLVAVLIGTLILFLAEVAKAGWQPLAWATMTASHWLLSLYESNVVMNVDTYELGVGGFVVTISAACSGYEGIGLVTAFLSVYTWVFRQQLAFPNALLLFPVGVVTIWLLNVARIAVLVSAGAHFSPAMAVNGFHSQAGWISFLLVTISIMCLAPRVSFLWRTTPVRGAAVPVTAAPAGDAPAALEWLAPFMALMTASIIISAFSPNEQWLYGLRVLAVGSVLFAFRGFYRTLVTRVSPLAIVAGLGVGVAWIATDPDPLANAGLGTWLAALPAGIVVAWLVLRALGAIIFVPIAEELAFRGYLHRVIARAHIGQLPPIAMTAIAFVVTSVMFGALHQRWLAGMLAGAVYALTLHRSNRIADPVAAHMASNALIIAWAYGHQQWSLI